MSSESKRFLILVGPLISFALIGVALESAAGSTQYVVAAYAAVAFFLVPPVIQVLLLATQRFGERDFLACAIGLAVPVLLVGAPLLGGVFSGGS